MIRMSSQIDLNVAKIQMNLIKFIFISSVLLSYILQCPAKRIPSTSLEVPNQSISQMKCIVKTVSISDDKFQLIIHDNVSIVIV